MTQIPFAETLHCPFQGRLGLQGRGTGGNMDDCLFGQNVYCHKRIPLAILKAGMLHVKLKPTSISFETTNWDEASCLDPATTTGVMVEPLGVVPTPLNCSLYLFFVVAGKRAGEKDDMLSCV